MSFPYLDESMQLDEITRSKADGCFVQLSDGMTHYQGGGKPAEVPVVLVHGFSVPYFIYDRTFDFLAASGFHVLRYDLFGRGYSDRPLRNYDIELFTRQLKELLDALAMPCVDLIGLSMGGPITAAFINEYPHRVARHVLIDP